MSIDEVYLLELPPLGQGSFGIVYSATRKKDQMKCALKRIALPVEERKKRKFEKESRALYHLRHKHIVKSFMPTYTFKEGPAGKFLQQYFPQCGVGVIELNAEMKCSNKLTDQFSLLQSICI